MPKLKTLKKNLVYLAIADGACIDMDKIQSDKTFGELGFGPEDYNFVDRELVNLLQTLGFINESVEFQLKLKIGPEYTGPRLVDDFISEIKLRFN